MRAQEKGLRGMTRVSSGPGPGPCAPPGVRADADRLSGVPRMTIITSPKVITAMDDAWRDP
jgi:hypothetical protein